DPVRPATAHTVCVAQIRVPLVERLAGSPRAVLAVIVAISALSLWSLHSATFDYNLLNLQAKGTESVVWEKRILATSRRRGVAGPSAGSSLDELRDKQVAFKKLSTVAEVDSVLDMIPAEQEAKQKIIRDFAPLVASVRIARPRSIDVPRLLAGLETLGRRLDIAKADSAGEGKRRL